ncbi:carbohydrate sulfotransferase 1-like [Amphiura filiformis]|uniref:carbohydrate sulfotransferase 1-like n=1 Tax=Amphiura filiformis TaxID=82378 RepID=UPI003B213E96
MEYRHFFIASVLVCSCYVILHISVCSDTANCQHVTRIKSRNTHISSPEQKAQTPHGNMTRTFEERNFDTRDRDFMLGDKIHDITTCNSTCSTNIDKVQVIIVTRWRSGSSFLGEIFNNDPDFIYFFEPLIGKMTFRNKFDDEHTTILHDIVKCEFANKNYNWWDGQVPTNCERSQTFGKTILCGNFRKRLKANYDQSSRIIEELCRSRTHVAIKTVRVPDISFLKNIITNSKLNVKVIHLVRDVRALYFSRKSTKGVNDMEYSECDELEKNLRFWQDPPSWIKGHHMLLRYEDLADEPLLITQKMYEFLGVKVPETVKMWLQYNTNWKERGEYSRSRIS